MKTIRIKQRKIDREQYYGRYASLDDVSNVVDQDTIVECDGKIVLGFIKDIGGPLEELRKSLSGHKFGTATRATKSAAMWTQAAVFGYQPRITLRPSAAMCRIAKLAKDNPQVHDLLTAWTTRVTEFYERLAPDAAQHHKRETKNKIPAEYQIPKSMFTSGIVNKSNQLPYHYDSGNFEGAWSAMLALTQGIDGGHLVIPEYDLALAITDGSLSFFDGQAKLHGVTPFTRTRTDAERYTIVWYSLRKLWECLPRKEEIRLANSRMTNNNRKKRKDLK